MAASNTVEATLLSKFEDGVSRGIAQTQKTIGQAFSSMKDAGALFNSGMSGIWGSVTGGLDSYRQRLRQAAEESDSGFAKMGFGAAAFALVVVGAVLKAGQAVTSFLFNLVKESSEALEARMAFDSLTQSMNIQADVLLGKLKAATEGQISNTVLLHNANRVLQSGVPITTDVYGKLVENVFRLAKAAGVDGAQAVQTLTDALIRGNARGFQAIGINISVKDAVSAMAEAQGQHANSLENHSRLQAFYNELLSASGAAVGRLGTGFLTLEDILKQADVTWSGFLGSLGQAIGRSGTLQGLLESLNGEMLKTGMSRNQLDQLTLATNRFVVSFLQGLANVLIILGATITAVEVFWATVKAAFNIGAGAVILVVLALQETLTQFVEVLARIPGAAKLGLTGLAGSMRESAELLKRSLISAGHDTAHAFDGIGEAEKKLDEFGYAAARTAGELSGMEGKILQGTAGVNQHGAAAANTAEQLKKLNEQHQKYAEIWKELSSRSGNPQAAAQAQLFADFSKIDQDLTLKGVEWDGKRNALKQMALRDYYAKLQELQSKAAADAAQEQEVKQKADAAIAQQQTDSAQALAFLDKTFSIQRFKNEQEYQDFLAKCAKEREEQRQKEVSESLAAANVIQRTIELASQGKISPQVGQDALSRLPQTIALLKTKIDELRSRPILTEQQIDDLTKLQTKLDQLNRLTWTPFQHALQTMRQDISQFAQTATESFAAFFSNLVTGQEGAGKKLLAAFIGMIGQMLVHVGIILVQTGIAEIALAQTLVGKLMGASVGAGLKAIAIGALIAAAGGIMEGMASNLAQTSSAGGAASQTGTQQAAAPSQAQVINVAAPRGPQNPGEASGAAGQEPVQVHLKIDAEEGFVVRQVERNVRNNGRLRVVIQNA
jgi:hypothetical protein